RHITAQLVLYLVALKESRVLHRDLRSANVLLDKEGNVRVTGLGCAKRFRLCSGQDVDHVCGAPRSRAPERHQKRAYSYESDLFSVGILMYEMLTGRLPWGEGASVEELADQVSRAPLKFVESDHIGPHARDLLVRLLEKDPSKRIKLDEVVSHKFF
ncbi:kinase-like domain-containing protein, partial [Mycena rebaudengoi]